MTQVKCDNCEWTGKESETQEIADFWSRADVGGEVPAGDCPECGAFCYLVKPATVPPDMEMFPPEDWQYEVANGDTRLGYLDWALHRAEAELEADPAAPDPYETIKA